MSAGGPSPVEVVDAINAVSGAHDGARAAHAKGTLIAATFTPTAGGAAADPGGRTSTAAR